MNWNGFVRKRSWVNFKVLFRHLPRGDEKNHENLRIAGLRAGISAQYLPNTKQK
jgi:hypothetical protein